MAPYAEGDREMKSEALVTPAVRKQERKGGMISEVGGASPRRMLRICSRALTSERVMGVMMREWYVVKVQLPVG